MAEHPNVRGGSGRFERSVIAAEQDAEACRLRYEGFSYREIADTMDCAISTAHDRVERALATIPRESAEALLQRELDLLDEMQQEALSQLRGTYALVSYGKVIEGELDSAPRRDAIHTLLKIQERRAKYTGLDAPTKSQHEVTVHDGDSDLDREIAALLEGMGRLEQGTPALEAPSEGEPTHT